MFNGSDSLIRSDSKSYGSALTLDEIFITRQEGICFTQSKSNKRLFYQDIAAKIKKYGYGGITQLNNHHMDLIFSEQKPSDLYINKDSNHVSNLLLTYFIMCQHSSIKEQTIELWYILNPTLDEFVYPHQLLEALKAFTKISVDHALQLVSRYEAIDQFHIHMMTEALRYLRHALDVKDQFLDEIASTIPHQVSFAYFGKFVESLCFSPNQLRMAITKTEPSSVGLKVVTSGPATVIISYLSMEQKLTAHLVCRKWYYSFIPSLIPEFTINKVPDPKTLFRLFTDYEGQRYYLGAQRNALNDQREENGRTTYVSAGCSAEYLQFKWRLDEDRRLCLYKAPFFQNIVDKVEEAYLGAHRTFNIDVRGSCETYTLVTTFKAHEGFFSMLRVGTFEEKRCIIQITNNRCVNDTINHTGWSIDLPIRDAAARGEQSKYWFQNNQRPARNQDSVYVMLVKPTQQQIEGHQLMRVWNVEITGFVEQK